MNSSAPSPLSILLPPLFFLLLLWCTQQQQQQQQQTDDDNNNDVSVGGPARSAPLARRRAPQFYSPRQQHVPLTRSAPTPAPVRFRPHPAFYSRSAPAGQLRRAVWQWDKKKINKGDQSFIEFFHWDIVLLKKKSFGFENDGFSLFHNLLDSITCRVCVCA